MFKKVQDASPRAFLHSDQKLFRTSTTYLLDPTEDLEQQKLASFAKKTQNHVPYFAKAKPEEFQLEGAEFIALEEAQQSKKMAKPIPNRQKETINQQISTKKPQKKENRFPTPKSFTKISNVLKEAVAGHKFMKQKLKQIKIQQVKEKSLSPKSQQTNRKDRGFKFSLSPSPLPSPKHFPPSPRSPHSQRYPVAGSMTERYIKQQAELTELVQQYKIKKASKELDQCTFQPSLAAKAKNQRIMTELKQSKRVKQTRKAQQVENEGLFIKFQTKEPILEPKKSPFKFDDFKTLIKFQLERIPLNNK